MQHTRLAAYPEFQAPPPTGELGVLGPKALSNPLPDYLTEYTILSPVADSSFFKPSPLASLVKDRFFILLWNFLQPYCYGSGGPGERSDRCR